MTKRTTYRGYTITRNLDAWSLVHKGERHWFGSMSEAQAFVDAVRLERTLVMMEKN